MLSMSRWWVRGATFGSALVALLLCQARGVAALSIDLGDGTVSPGGTVTVAATVHLTDEVVVGLQNRVTFDRSAFIAPQAGGEPNCTVNPEIDKRASSFRFLPLGCDPERDCTAVRALILAFDNVTPLPDGATVYTCRVAAAAAAGVGDHPLHNDEVAGSGPAGEDIRGDGLDGVIHVRTAVVAIDLKGGSAPAGGALQVTARLHTPGASAVVATQNRIDFDAPLGIAARGDGNPDCTVNPAILKSASGFRFRPVDCDASGGCQAVVAVVLAFDNVEPIPDGAALYTCMVTVAADAAPGTYRLANSEIAAADSTGAPIPASGADGVVDVGAGAALGLAAGHVRAVAGQRVDVPVTLAVLSAAGAAVAGTENELGFDRLTPIAATPSGAPDCRINPDIDKTSGGFVFLPADCTPSVDCTGVRAVVLALDNTDPIPDGAELYRCTVAVDGAAPLGEHPVAIRNAAGADDAGADLSALGRGGSIEVICAGDCNGDGRVAISELLRGVNISLASAPASVCPVFDADGSGDIAINEIVQAVSSALRGCTPAA